MSRLVEKVNLPIYGEMYVACVEDVSMETMQALQEPLKKLYEYEQEEEKELLIHLPCKVGDKVYEPRPDRGFISEYVIKAVKVYDDGMFFCWECIDGIYSNISGFYDEEIGKTVFLTRKGAEQKLKEMEAL